MSELKAEALRPREWPSSCAKLVLSHTLVVYIRRVCVRYESEGGDPGGGGGLNAPRHLYIRRVCVIYDDTIHSSYITHTHRISLVVCQQMAIRVAVPDQTLPVILTLRWYTTSVLNIRRVCVIHDNMTQSSYITHTRRISHTLVEHHTHSYTNS